MLYTYYRPEHPPHFSGISINSKGYILENSDTKDININHPKYCKTLIFSEPFLAKLAIEIKTLKIKATKII